MAEVLGNNDIVMLDLDGWQGRRLEYADLASIADNLLLLLDGGELVGIAGWHLGGHTHHISALATKRGGYGAALIERLKLRLGRFSLYSAAPSTDAFYLKCGLRQSRPGSGYFWYD